MNKILIMVFFSLVPVYAQDSLYTIESILKEALDNNTALALAGRSFKSAGLDRAVTATLPDPVLMTEFRGLPVDARGIDETREWMFMFQQNVPFPGKLGTRAGLADHQTSIQKHNRDSIELDIKAAVKTVYYRLALIQYTLNRNQEQRQLTQKIKNLVDSAYRTGKVPLSENYRTEAEIAKLDVQRVELKQRRDTIAAQLNTLLNRPLSYPVGAFLPAQLPDPPPQPDSLIAPDHPAILAARARVRQQKSGLKLARLQRGPDLSLMGGYMAMNSMTDAWMGRLSVTLPFMPWSIKRNAAQISRARVETEKAEIKMTETVNNLKFETQKLFNHLNSLYEQINLTQNTIIPAYEKSLNLTQSEFITGQTDLTVLLEQTKQLVVQKITLAEMKNNYLYALVQLERVYKIRGTG